MLAAQFQHSSPLTTAMIQVDIEVGLKETERYITSSAPARLDHKESREVMLILYYM